MLDAILDCFESLCHKFVCVGLVLLSSRKLLGRSSRLLSRAVIVMCAATIPCNGMLGLAPYPFLARKETFQDLKKPNFLKAPQTIE